MKKKETQAPGAQGPAADEYGARLEEFLAAHPDAPVSEDIECLSLIMRKEFAMQILRGEKKVEIRAYSKFYHDRLFDRRVTAWSDAKAAEMEASGATEDEVDAFLADCVDLLAPLRPVKKIRFHNYDNTWYLEAECTENYQVAVVRDQVEELKSLYGCDEFDEMLEELEKKKAKDRPLYFYFVIGRILDTNLR